MNFFRVIPFSTGDDLITALPPPRALQGAGRHDNADLYTALYCSTDKIACVSEAIQNFTSLTDDNLFRAGKRLHLAQFALPEGRKIVNADDPRVLVERALRPSVVATRNRSVTQPIARTVYEAGEDGLLWWSTIESSWINATLFFEKVSKNITFSGLPTPLTILSNEIRDALQRQ